jgi:hypothetical protein
MELHTARTIKCCSAACIEIQGEAAPDIPKVSRRRRVPSPPSLAQISKRYMKSVKPTESHSS